MDISQSANQLYMLGMLNAFKTGNTILDGLFIILLPTIMGYISQLAYMIFGKINQSAKKLSNQDYYIQKIDYNISINNNNFHLYTAICMYTNSLNLDIKYADIETIVNSNQDGMPRSYITEYKNSSIEQIKLLYKPSIKNWIVATSDIELMFEQNTKNQEQYPNRNGSGVAISYIIYSISIRSKTLKNIQDFINNAINYYKNEMQNEKDNKRYLYLPKYGSTDYKFETKLMFDSHLLSDSKTFDSLFIPDKTNLIELLTNFQNHTGKYAISGVKQQLGLLLHGPSGTGKTSLIKSIANMFNRNIVTIPLGLLSTNYELFEIMFNLNYVNKDKKLGELARQMGMSSESITKTLDFNELVFVIEDIDAIGNIVHEREENYILEQEQEQEQEQEHSNDKLDDIGNALNMLTRTMQMPMPMPMPIGMQMGMPMGMGMPIIDVPKLSKKDNKENKIDKLNLAGILNAIDGIVDAPGRIIIITSNFPEKLDKALIRPGRIDKIIKLDYINEKQAIEMCEHFFDSEEIYKNETGIREIIRSHRFTPAQIEQYALESNNVPEFLVILQKNAKSK